MAYWLDQLVGKASSSSSPSDDDDDDDDDDDKNDKNESPPNTSEALQLAVRCQHIRRWTRPRQNYPTGLAGYKQWRKDLAKFHAQQAADILFECGYGADVVDRVGQLLTKQNLATDAEVQLLEDVICVVFLENEYTAFVEQNTQDYDDDRLVDIVQKTWGKMTPRGHRAALQLAGSLTERGLRVVERALEG
eukprot:scaffold3732_cov147-Amphora_coffeaeformis.AAC.3